MTNLHRFIPDADAVAREIPDLKNIQFHTRGGQKLVYTCSYEGTTYALKLIPLLEEINDEVAGMVQKRAEREIKIMETIKSPFFIKTGPTTPSIITISNKQFLQYTEELVDGTDLQKILMTRSLTIEETVLLAIQMTYVINEFWENSYIHRDIKPNNIMMKIDGTFVLLDAGVAFDLNDDSLTFFQEPVGTRIYMSPEQLQQTGRELDFRSDLFSLGVTLYEALTQKHPFVSNGKNGTQIIASILTASHIPLKSIRDDIPKHLDTVVNRLLAKRPHMRFKKCDLLLKEFNQIREEM